MKLTIRALVIAFICVVPLHAQREGPRLEQPVPVTLRFTVTVNDSMTKAQHVRLELMDAVGSSGAFDRRETDNDGMVTFQTLSGMHRYVISGPGIIPYEGEVELNRTERVHSERVIVRSKPGESPSPDGSPSPQQSVAAIRLKIPTKAKKQFERGTKALNRQEWDKSQGYFEAAIREYPEYDLAYDGLGIVYVQKNEVENAREAFRKAIALNPDFSRAYRDLARIYLSENNFPEALKLLKKSLETEPLDAWALTYAAYAELQAHNFEDALEDAKKVHVLPHVALANCHVIAARALEALQRNQEALQEWKLYLSEDPTGPNAERARQVLAAASATN